MGTKKAQFLPCPIIVVGTKKTRFLRPIGFIFRTSLPGIERLSYFHEVGESRRKLAFIGGLCQGSPPMKWRAIRDEERGHGRGWKSFCQPKIFIGER